MSNPKMKILARAAGLLAGTLVAVLGVTEGTSSLPSINANLNVGSGSQQINQATATGAVAIAAPTAAMPAPAAASDAQFGIVNRGGSVGEQEGKGRASILNDGTAVGKQKSDTSSASSHHSAPPNKRSELKKAGQPMLDAHGQPCKFILDKEEAFGNIVLGAPAGTDISGIPDGACIIDQEIAGNFGWTRTNTDTKIEHQNAHDNYPAEGNRPAH